MPARTPKVSFANRIDTAFESLKHLGFAPTQIARVFFERIRRKSELGAVKTELLHCPVMSEIQLVGTIIDIREQLDRRFNKRKPLTEWLRAPLAELGNKSPREMLLSGLIPNICLVHNAAVQLNKAS